MTERDNLYFGVIAEIERLGFPHEFGAAVAQQLGGPKSLGRMLSYLRLGKPKRPEDIADEMVAILDERAKWQRKKAAESANSRYNAYLNTRMPDDDE